MSTTDCYVVMVRTLSKCKDPKGDAGNSVATSRASHAAKTEGER